jgi:hypothetical protein
MYSRFIDSKFEELQPLSQKGFDSLPESLFPTGFLGYLKKDIDEGNFEQAVRDFSQINDAAKTMGGSWTNY